MRGEAVLDDVASPDPEHDISVQMRFARDQVADDVTAHDLLVNRVGLHVLAVEAIRSSASTRRREPGDEVISVDAKCPMAAPKNSRCSPNIDIRFTTASESAGTSSR